jgi:hypothetical protein
MMKADLTKSGRALYVSLAKSVRTNRASCHTQLHRHLVELNLPGVTHLTISAETYYVMVFESVILRDNAQRIILQSVFAPQGDPVAFVAHGFGDLNAKPKVIWSVPTGPVTNSEIVREAIIEHFHTNFPKYSTTFTARAKKDLGYCSGEWAVCSKVPPLAFVKKIDFGTEQVLISQEPLYTCRFCGRTGYNLFECQEEGEKTLDNAEVEGSAHRGIDY